MIGGVFQQCTEHIITNTRWLFIHECLKCLNYHKDLAQTAFFSATAYISALLWKHVNINHKHNIQRVLQRTYPLIYLKLIDLTLISCIGTKHFTSLGSSNLANLSFCLCVASFDYNAIPLENYIKNIKNVYSSRPAIMFYPQLSVNILHEAASTTL